MILHQESHLEKLYMQKFCLCRFEKFWQKSVPEKPYRVAFIISTHSDRISAWTENMNLQLSFAFNIFIVGWQLQTYTDYAYK